MGLARGRCGNYHVWPLRGLLRDRKERDREREMNWNIQEVPLFDPFPGWTYVRGWSRMVVHKSLCHMWLCILRLRICCATESSANIRIVILMSALDFMKWFNQLTNNVQLIHSEMTRFVRTITFGGRKEGSDRQDESKIHNFVSEWEAIILYLGFP